MAENQNDFNQEECHQDIVAKKEAFYVKGKEIPGKVCCIKSDSFHQAFTHQDVVIKKELPDCLTKIKSEPFDIESSADNRCQNFNSSFYFSQFKTEPLEDDTDDNDILQNNRNDFDIVKKNEEMPVVTNEGQDSMEDESTATIENEKTNLKCYKCEAKFAGDIQVILLRRHLRIHVDKKPYSCDVCPNVIDDQTKIIDHLFAHSKKPYTCGKCHRRFLTDLHLNKHFKKSHKSHDCEECGINFYSKSEFSKHNMKLRHYACSLCERAFVSKVKLTHHVELSHSKAKPFKYDPDDKILAKCFKKESSGSESPFKPFRCGKCGKKFKTCTSLGDHLRSNGEKEFIECKECQVEFFARCAFTRHFKIHHRNNCNSCGKTFNNHKTLMTHLEDYVLGKEPTVCDVCQSEIIYGCHFQRH